MSFSGIKPEDIDILVTTCSIFCPTPSLASLVVNHFKLRSDVQSYHLGGMGCSNGVVACNLVKDMLKVGGENVATAEIEAFLLTHPAIDIVAVTGVRDAPYTEVPAAFVELAPGASLTEEELLSFCVGSIATFKVPRYLRLVSAWPMSGTKIRKHVLREGLEAELDAAGIAEAARVR